MNEHRTAETIHDGIDAADGMPITAEIDRSSDPGNPTIRLECGCNEFWLDIEQAQAVYHYLQRAIPLLGSGESG